MNTRLQVEHPVTELVTGLDLVHLQLRIASGEKLPFRQEDVRLRGHAIECRIYAEDPDNNFFPSPGKITKLLRPSGPGVREDSGVYEGWTVPLDYDPMLSKLIAYAPDRPTAIARMRRALDEYFVGGIKTNLPLFRRILEHPDFVNARIDTGFLDRLLADRSHSRVLKMGWLRLRPFPPHCLPPRRNQRMARTAYPRPGSRRRTDASMWKRTARREGVGGE